MRAKISAFCALALAANCAAQDAPAEPAEPSEAPPPDLVVPPAEPRPDEGAPSPAATPSPPPQAAPEPAPAPDNGITPPAFPLSRYAALWERSPFQLESIAPPVESPALAQRYALTGIAEINNEPIVFVMERATQRRHMLDKKTNSAGLSLVQVDLQQKYTNSTATIREGADVGVVRFDATAAVAPPAAPRPGQPVPVRPPGPATPAQPGQPQPVSAPSQPGAAPAAAAAPPPGVVPPTAGPAAPAAGQVSAPADNQDNNPPGRVIRRRAVIPSSP